MSNESYLKPSLFVQNLTPQLDNEAFLNFLTAYYQWLESSTITFKSRVGNFTVGETIVEKETNPDTRIDNPPDIIKAKGIIKEIGNNYLVIKMLTKSPFNLKSTIYGQTSGATASVVNVKDNVVRAAARALENKNPDFATDKYFEYFKSENNHGFATLSEVDRRFISNKLKDFYKSKSNEDAYRFLFRALYNQEIEFRYPGEEVLRVSDGKFEKTSLMRVQLSTPTSKSFDYLNQTIVGKTSGAVGNVVDIKLTVVGGIQCAEMTLKLVSGTFASGEIIEILGTPLSNTVVYGMLTGSTIVDAGSGYSVGDVLTVTGDGSEATAEVSSVSSGPINKIKINTIGHGYRLGTFASVNNSGTGGTNFSLKVSEISNTYTVTSGANTYTLGEITKVSIVNRGSDYTKAPIITLDDSPIKSLGMLSEKLITINSGGSNYEVGDALVFTGGAGANAAGQVASVGNTVLSGVNATYGANNIIFEDSTVLLLEENVNGLSSAIKDEDWVNSGPILRIELSNFGNGYTESSLPAITVTSTSGTSANLVATDIQGNSANVEVDVANNAIGLGSIRSVTITNFGIDYTSASIDTSTTGDGNANVQPVISGIGISDGIFLNDDGKVSYKILQDSLFYQDFSYVIRSGLVFDAYNIIVKEALHPAGLQFFGEILISSYILAAARFTSIIAVEEEEIEIIIKQILSFFPGSINPITMNIEKDIELVPVDVFTGGILNEDGDHLLYENGNVGYHITKEGPQNNRRLHVNIVPYIDVSRDFLREINVDIPLFIDATMAFYSEVVTLESVRTTEVDIVLGPQNVTPSQAREINVEIVPTTINRIANFITEYIIDVGAFLDASMAFYSEVITLESVRTTEVDIVLGPQNLVSNEYREIEVEFVSLGNLISEFSTTKEFSLFIQKNIDTSVNTPIIEQTVEIDKLLQINNFDIVEKNTSTYGQLKIVELQNRPISDYSAKRFSDSIPVSIRTNEKISGTVTIAGKDVVGTNTSFNVDFSENQTFIVGDEKFIVTNIANSTFMTINANTVGTYTGVSAYREFLI